MNKALYAFASCGTQTAGLTFGGAAPIGQEGSEQWDGTNWVTGPNLAIGKWKHASGTAATSSAALKFGGGPPPDGSNPTEEFTGETTATATVKTIDFD
jgi:hypothetical protein